VLEILLKEIVEIHSYLLTRLSTATL